MQISISVVVPTFKRPQLLKKCLLHLSTQTFDKTKYEIIIVSDGPDAETSDYVSRFHSCKSENVRFLFLPAKKGPAAARNLGWQNANGTLVAFTDDDCLPGKTWLENIWSHYNNEAEIAFTGKVIVPVSDKPTDFELNTKGLETGDFVTANCVCTKVVLEAVGGFDEAFTTAWREDSDLEFKLLSRKVPIKRLNEAVVVHPVRPAEWGVSVKEQRKAMFNALLFRKYPELYKQRLKTNFSSKYYLIILFFAAFVASVFLKLAALAIVGLLGWLYLTVGFIYQRVRTTRKTFSHIFEMIATSFLIPFVSVYWTIYGSIKYKVFFF